MIHGAFNYIKVLHDNAFYKMFPKLTILYCMTRCYIAEQHSVTFVDLVVLMLLYVVDLQVQRRNETATLTLSNPRRRGRDRSSANQ